METAILVESEGMVTEVYEEEEEEEEEEGEGEEEESEVEEMVRIFCHNYILKYLLFFCPFYQ